MKLISIIIPAYNEEKNIPLIFAQLKEVFLKLPQYAYEIIFVNDGSKDNSWLEIKKLSETSITVKGISFSRNFGHQAAIEAGLESSKGDAVIMMDADLQHPPTLITKLVEKWESGFRIVNTKRLKTKNETFFKRMTSKFFYWFINKISDIHLDEGAADYRLLDRKVVNELIKLTEKDKFYRGLIKWVGFKVTFVEYEANDRKNGSSSYTLKKMIDFARIGITSFSLLPMKMILIFGFLMFSGGTIMLFVMLYYRWILDKPRIFSGNAILASIIIISNGFIIMTIGIISLYQITMFRELKNRPTYIIDETTSHE